MNIKPEQLIAYGLISLGCIVTLISIPILAIALGIGLLFKDDIKKLIK